MPANADSAVVIAIGDELLLGEIENTNTRFICNRLSRYGTEVKQSLVLPDDPDVIADEIATAKSSADLVITCGGIGPTPDDQTRQAVARACNVDLELNDAAVEGYSRLRGSELNDGQLEMCRLPAGCELLWSGYPSPPAFRINNIYVFPGVPQILKSAWDGVADRFRQAEQHVVSFKTGKGESRWFRLMQEFMVRYPDLKIGSYPKMGDQWRVEIRIRGSNLEKLNEVANEFQQAIENA